MISLTFVIFLAKGDILDTKQSDKQIGQSRKICAELGLSETLGIFHKRVPALYTIFYTTKVQIISMRLLGKTLKIFQNFSRCSNRLFYTKWCKNEPSALRDFH